MARTTDTNQPWGVVTRPLARLVFPSRHVGIVAAAVAVLLLPSFGPDRWTLALICVGVLLPVDVLMHVLTRRHGQFPVWMPLVSQCSSAAVVLVVPEALAPLVLLLLADNALTAMVFGRRRALVVGALGVGLLAGTTAVVDVVDPWPSIVALLLSTATCSIVLGGIAEGERTLRARYGTLVSDVDVIVWELVPGTNRFTYVSSGAHQLLGYPTAEWYRPGFWTDHLHPDDAERTLAELDAAIEAGRDHVLEYRMVHADGHDVHLRDVAAVELDPTGRLVNMRGVMMDITDLRRAEALLREQATHDVLTGLPNRALLGDRLERALERCRRAGGTVALLLLDLDEFKEVNDALGHEAGDRLLVAFAARLTGVLREADAVARLGGDEFAVLLTDGGDASGAVTVAQRILASLDEPFELDGLQLHTGASIGIALFPDHAADREDLVGRADVAMYQAKRTGRGHALYEHGLERSGARRLTLLGELRHALANEELVLEYQPSFDLGTGRLAAVEALLRWDHPEQGRIGPSGFIRLAEMSGLIEPLTHWVVERAVEARRAAGLEVPVAVNLSVRNLADVRLVPWLAEVVERWRLGPGQLLLELTESAVLTDIDAATKVLTDIRALGVEIAIDDFGTGQSALAYLKDLPVDEVKIDRTFVEGVGHDATDAAICGAIVRLAHELGLRAVAEGATSAEDVRVLRELGCDRVQGFFLGRPIPARSLVDLAPSPLLRSIWSLPAGGPGR